MVDNGEMTPKGRFVLIFLNLGSLMLLLGSVYIMKELAIFYGVGVGAYLQGIHDNATTFAPSVAAAANLSTLQAVHTAILESYVLMVVAFGLMAGAYMMLIKRNERNNIAQTRYVPFHAAMVAVFVLMLYLILSTPYTTIQNLYMDITYAGVVICFCSDFALDYISRTGTPAKGARMKHTIALDPSRPFSNMMDLKENLFANLSGHLRIVDKHFNSTALSNLHRLVEDSKGNYTKITILTSADMLDSDINASVSDFRNELGSSGVGLEMRIMDSKDTAEQHERILLDDKIAYKVPPFNIINKKSEHITTISYEQANRRFRHLYERAIKLDNYMTKQARTENSGNPPPGA